MNRSYTYRYGRSYEEWVDENSMRIWRCLMQLYYGGFPLDIQMLTYNVYRERLEKVSKTYWKPVLGFLLDRKPSAFIKNFIDYLIRRMVEDGYAYIEYIVVSEARGETITLTTSDELEIPSLIEEEISIFVDKYGDEVKQELKTTIRREVKIVKLPSLDWVKSLRYDIDRRT